MSALPLVAAFLLHASPDPSALAEIAEGADEVHIALVESSFSGVGPAPRLDDRSPVRKLSRKDAKQVSALVAAIARSKEPLQKFCGFNPDLRVTFKKGAHSVRAVFCFSCSDVIIQRTDGQPSGTKREFREHMAALEALVARVFADLPEEKRQLGNSFP